MWVYHHVMTISCVISILFIRINSRSESLPGEWFYRIQIVLRQLAIWKRKPFKMSIAALIFGAINLETSIQQRNVCETFRCQPLCCLCLGLLFDKFSGLECSRDSFVLDEFHISEVTTDFHKVLAPRLARSKKARLRIGKKKESDKFPMQRIFHSLFPEIPFPN